MKNGICAFTKKNNTKIDLMRVHVFDALKGYYLFLQYRWLLRNNIKYKIVFLNFRASTGHDHLFSGMISLVFDIEIKVGILFSVDYRFNNGRICTCW
jgi:hypothetical protein